MAVTPSFPMLPKGMILTKFMAYSSAEVMFNPVSATNNCIDTAGVVILRNCSPCKEAIIWYDECSIRYSNRSFFLPWRQTHHLICAVYA
ncbi:hypothetical protein HYC85_017435 [Camellia sinensis]|uniref:Gnk2-homologous domain-containing protein n=1 Tax=Camellia sinensis TaxID=4442 RepID=A0A7J7GVB4_CAMSI|nr:hypothetical protein HYC85_017435 [Camellia sinensis]